MGRLIIIIECFAEGKRYIEDYLLSKSALNAIFIKKYTTRYPREYEMNNDFIFNSCVEIKKCTYTYFYQDICYGIKKDEIDVALVNNRNPVIFLTNTVLIEKLKRDYPHTLTVYILDMIYDKALEINCDLKYEMQEKIFLDSVEYIKKKLYDYCIVNIFDESFVQQLELILKHELKSNILKKVLQFSFLIIGMIKMRWMKLIIIYHKKIILQ